MIHLLLVPKLIMRGVIPLLFHTSSWHSASLNTGTTYLLPSLLNSVFWDLTPSRLAKLPPEYKASHPRREYLHSNRCENLKSHILLSPSSPRPNILVSTFCPRKMPTYWQQCEYSPLCCPLQAMQFFESCDKLLSDTVHSTVTTRLSPAVCYRKHTNQFGSPACFVFCLTGCVWTVVNVCGIFMSLFVTCALHWTSRCSHGSCKVITILRPNSLN
jgi:hypothetical protein